MIPLVLEGGLTLSSVLVGMIESRGDCDLVLLSELSAFSPSGIGDAEVTGGNVNVPVIDEGECALKRVLDPGFVKLGGVNGAKGGNGAPSDPAPLLEDGEVGVDSGR